MCCSFEKKSNMNNTKILDTYLKNTSKKPFGSKPPSRLLFGFVFMMRYHCILFFFNQKQIMENTGKIEKYTKHNFQARNYPPGLIFGSYSWFVILACYSCAGNKQFWKIPDNTRKTLRTIPEQKAHYAQKPPSRPSGGRVVSSLDFFQIL